MKQRNSVTVITIPLYEMLSFGIEEFIVLTKRLRHREDSNKETGYYTLSSHNLCNINIAA